MPSPFDMITHSPIMQLANLARAGQNPMGLIQQLSGQNAPIMQGLNLIQGKNEAQLRTMGDICLFYPLAFFGVILSQSGLSMLQRTGCRCTPLP